MLADSSLTVLITSFVNELYANLLCFSTTNALYQLPLTSVNGQEMPQFPGGL